MVPIGITTLKILADYYCFAFALNKNVCYKAVAVSCLLVYIGSHICFFSHCDNNLYTYESNEVCNQYQSKGPVDTSTLEVPNKWKKYQHPWI